MTEVMRKPSLQGLLGQPETASMLAVEGAKLDFAMGLATLLERAKLSRSELAAKLGVSAPMVTKILRGDANLTIETMVKAARAAEGTLHIKIVPENSQCRWFELVQNERSRPVGPPAAALRPQVSKVTSWSQGEAHETESVAA